MSTSTETAAWGGNMGLWTALGVAAGAATGVATGDVAVWTALGGGAGLALGAVQRRRSASGR